MTRFWLVAALTPLFFFSAPATADNTTVLIVGSETQKPLVEALQLELDAAAFDTRVEWRAPKPEPFADFAAVADDSEATVWIRLFDDARVDIWIAEPKSDKVLHREAILDSEGRTAPVQAAMEIAELLRATQLELFEVEAAALTPLPVEENSPTPPESSSAPEPVPETKEIDDKVGAMPTEDAAEETTPADESPPTVRRLFVEIGPGITAGSFSHPPAAYLTLTTEWRFIERIGAVIFGHIPLSSTRTEAPEGAATLKNGVVGVEARMTFPGLLKRFRPSIGLGAALSISRIEGEAEPGFVSQNETLFTARIHLRIFGAVRITEHLAFTFGGLLAHSTTGVTVAIAGERTLDWGDIILDGYFGFEIGLL